MQSHLFFSLTPALLKKERLPLKDWLSKTLLLPTPCSSIATMVLMLLITKDNCIWDGSQTVFFITFVYYSERCSMLQPKSSYALLFYVSIICTPINSILFRPVQHLNKSNGYFDYFSWSKKGISSCCEYGKRSRLV